MHSSRNDLFVLGWMVRHYLQHQRSGSLTSRIPPALGVSGVTARRRMTVMCPCTISSRQRCDCFRCSLWNRRKVDDAFCPSYGVPD